MYKKSVNQIIVFSLLLVISFISVIIYLKIIKNTMLDNDFKIEKKLQFIYDKVSPNYLSEIEKFCKEKRLNCIYNYYENAVDNNNYINVYIGLITNPNKYIIGLVEKPIIFSDFNGIPKNINFITKNNIYLKNGKLFVEGSSPSLYINFPFSLPNEYKVYIKSYVDNTVKLFFNESVFTITKSSDKIDIFKDASLLKEISITGEFNDISFYVGKNLEISVNKNLVYKGKREEFKNISVSGDKIILDAIGFFDASENACENIQNCVKLDNSFSGKELTDFVIIYDFLPYDSVPYSYYHVLFFSSNENKIDVYENGIIRNNVFVDLENNKYKINNIDNIRFSSSLLELYKFDTILNIIKKNFIGPFRADIKNIKTSSNNFLIVNTYEDLFGQDKVPYVKYKKFNDKLISVKTILSKNGKIKINDYYTGFEINYLNQKFITIPYSNDIEYTLSILSQIIS